MCPNSLRPLSSQVLCSYSHIALISFAVAQIVCFEAGDTACTTMPMPGGADSIQDCCFTTDRGGRGGGSYSATGNTECFSCMTVVGNCI